MRGVELAGLLAGVGREVADQVLVDVAEHIVALLAVHRDVADELQQRADRLGLRPGGVPQLREAGLEGVEDLVEHVPV